MWELLLAFGLFYILQRAALWVAHLSIDHGEVGFGVAGAEMLRTTQVSEEERWTASATALR